MPVVVVYVAELRESPRNTVIVPFMWGVTSFADGPPALAVAEAEISADALPLTGVLAIDGDSLCSAEREGFVDDVVVFMLEVPAGAISKTTPLSPYRDGVHWQEQQNGDGV